MSAQLIAFVGFIYLAVAVDQAMKGSPMAIAWLGYSLANVGLALASK